MAEITYCTKYAPLYDLKTRYCIITGGRGSGKSHAESAAEVVNTFTPGQVALFTRYTMASAEISIIPEFWDKVELMGYNSIFHKSDNSIRNKLTNSFIYFRGIKTSSGNQTANLKSISGLTRWILDEAEELTDETIFDKIDLSIREKDANIRVIMILNPTDENHFLMRRFFRDKGVDYDFNGVKGDCTYIHTTYLDNIQNLDDSFIKIADEVKERDPDKYRHIFLGYPTSASAGAVYKSWQSVSVFPDNLYTWYGVDFGFVNDPTAIMRIAHDRKTRTIYLHEVCYRKGMSNSDIARVIFQDYREMDYVLYDDGDNIIRRQSGVLLVNGNTVEASDVKDYLTTAGLKAIYPYISKELSNRNKCITPVYCDSAEQKSIADLRIWGLSAYPCIKGAGSVVSQINFVNFFNIRYTEGSLNITNELANYVWAKAPDGQYLNKPVDAFNHLMDAARYGIFTELNNNGYEYDEILGAKEAQRD